MSKVAADDGVEYKESVSERHSPVESKTCEAASTYIVHSRFACSQRAPRLRWHPLTRPTTVVSVQVLHTRMLRACCNLRTQCYVHRKFALFKFKPCA